MTIAKPGRGQEGRTAKNVVSRFAPSPTGRLHLGHAYSALLAYDFARDRGGAFLLRIEDIDPGRSRQEHIAGITEDLAWLGMTWDGDIVRQSQRLPLYADALDKLKAKDLIYPCFCTRAAIATEIAASASAPHGPDGPIYPGTCRTLSTAERATRMPNEPHAWRLDVAKAATPLPLAGGMKPQVRLPDEPGSGFMGGHSSPSLLGEGDRAQRGGGAGEGDREAVEGPLTWIDHGKPVPAHPEQFGDVVLARKDAPTSYHLAVTIDDAAQGITDIVRGTDLYPSTHIHRLLQALLDLPTPHYHHHPLLTDPHGQRLAKRSGATSLADLRAAGVDPEQLVDNLRKGILPAGILARSA